MRISDWSSDVCSSDLCEHRRQVLADLACLRFELARIGFDLGLDLVAVAGEDAAQCLARGAQAEVRALHPDVGAGRGHGDDPGPVFEQQRALCFIRSEEHTSELQSLMRLSYAVFCLNKQKHLL